MNSLREVVFGLEDGIVSTLGSITGIAAATHNSFFIILAGFVIIFVESLSMAAGTFLASKTDREMNQRIIAEERAEIDSDPEGQRQKLSDHYRARGFNDEEISILVNRITQNKDLWLEEMAHKDLGVSVDPSHTPGLDGVFMGVSYVIGGFVSLIPYFFLEAATAIPLSIGACVIALFAVGWVKGYLVRVNAVKSGLEMLLISLSAVAVGYGVGQVISYYFGV